MSSHSLAASLSCEPRAAAASSSAALHTVQRQDCHSLVGPVPDPKSRLVRQAGCFTGCSLFPSPWCHPPSSPHWPRRWILMQAAGLGEEALNGQTGLVFSLTDPTCWVGGTGERGRNHFNPFFFFVILKLFFYPKEAARLAWVSQSQNVFFIRLSCHGVRNRTFLLALVELYVYVFID